MGLRQQFPHFPDDVPCHPLLVVDYALLQADDPDEVEKLWNAATGLGFWYLKNHGMDELVDEMFALGAEIAALPLEEKLKFDQGATGRSSGYKPVGASQTDPNGTKDNAEFINIIQDEVLSYPAPINSTYPDPVNANMISTVKPFCLGSLEINKTFMRVLETKLGLPRGTFEAMHRPEEHSGSLTRIIHSPPLAEGVTKEAFLMAHTDFGSLSILHNRMGGLQVLVPGTQDWQYVKPIEGHAICNLGDAMVIFSGGILHANLHRVVMPPGYQRSLDRWSLVYFSRPANSLLLKALTEDSTLIRDAVARNANDGGKDRFNPGSTAGEWVARRTRGTRTENGIGQDVWNAGRGMEHAPEAF